MQKVSRLFAYACYLAAPITLLTALYRIDSLGNDAVAASLLAATVFFIGCGIVLQVIGSVRLPNLKPDSNKDP